MCSIMKAINKANFSEFIKVVGSYSVEGTDKGLEILDATGGRYTAVFGDKTVTRWDKRGIYNLIFGTLEGYEGRTITSRDGSRKIVKPTTPEDLYKAWQAEKMMALEKVREIIGEEMYAQQLANIEAMKADKLAEYEKAQKKRAAAASKIKDLKDKIKAGKKSLIKMIDESRFDDAKTEIDYIKKMMADLDKAKKDVQVL